MRIIVSICGQCNRYATHLLERAGASGQHAVTEGRRLTEQEQGLQAPVLSAQLREEFARPVVFEEFLCDDCFEEQSY